jgi:hypothetical protein
MQERLLKILQMLQYRHTGGWIIKMTNENLGPNGTLEDSTISALESLGFETSATKTGLHQATFSSMIVHLIPTVPYTDHVTWTKYGCNLFPSAGCITDNYEMTKAMRSYMVEFL